MLWLVGWTLRVPVLSDPPLATRIADAFALGETGVGALTMLPVVAVAFGAIPAAMCLNCQVDTAGFADAERRMVCRSNRLDRAGIDTVPGFYGCCSRCNWSRSALSQLRMK